MSPRFLLQKPLQLTNSDENAPLRDYGAGMWIQPWPFLSQDCRRLATMNGLCGAIATQRRRSLVRVNNACYLGSSWVGRRWGPKIRVRVHRRQCSRYDDNGAIVATSTPLDEPEGLISTLCLTYMYILCARLERIPRKQDFVWSPSPLSA